MKADIKKVLYPISAVVLALGLGIGAILLSMLNVQASTEMMPGIEQILDEKSSETPFRILELVNKSTDAEIGYYIAGQEPYLTQYKYTPTNTDGSEGDSQTFSSVEEGLSVLPTEEQRREFVQGSNNMVKNPLTSGIAWNEGSTGTTQVDYPLSFKSYVEKYFLSKTDDATKWNRVDFKENRKETLTGHYEENSSGKGDYTKEEQKYYPIREGVDTDGSTTQKYRENVKNFFYSDDSEASAPYQLSFEKVDNDDVREALVNNDEEKRKELEASYDYSNGGFGYYENVYGELTSQMAEDIAKGKYTFPGENPVVSNTSADDTTGTDKDSDSANGSDNADDSDNVDGDNTDINSEDSGDSDTEELSIYDTDGLKGGEDDEIEIEAMEKNHATAGTQVNPYIYLGQNIEEHPYYKYTYIGDLEYVKEQAETNEGTSKRKNGDITLEDGQYWYWRAESTDNGDDVDSGDDIDTQSDESSDIDEEELVDSSKSVDSSNSVDSSDNSDVTDGGSAESADNSDAANEKSAKSTHNISKKAGDESEVSAQAAEGDTGNDTVLKKEALYIVTGRQAVSESQVKAIPTDFTYNYYYKVKTVKYCSKLSKDGQKTDPEDYTYYGWYYASHPSNEDTYIEADENAENASQETDVSDWKTKATHYISEAQYTLTPGKGNYDFVEGTSTTDTKQSVELDHLFYQGGYTNYNWFKRYVFHLDPDSKDETIQKQFKNLSIKVDTKVINTNGTGTGASELSKEELNKYDLIYVNGKLSPTQASNIAATIKLPAIINQKTAMGSDSDKETINQAFAAYINEQYTGTPYISERIYFTDGDLCNLKFHTDFTSTQLGAFSEISEYIKSENNYREVVESGENGQTTERLKEDISQARVIEYIINYQYKREVAHKKEVNILDIEPASATASLTKDNVREWLGSKSGGKIESYCCEQEKGEPGTNGPISNIIDGDESTYWHSQYDPKGAAQPHWFVYEMSEEADIKGFNYTPRPKTNNNGGLNGRPYVLKFEMYDKQNNLILTESVTLANNENDISSMTKEAREFKAGVIKNVKSIKVTFEQTYTTAGNHKASEFATCAEFSPVYADDDTSNVEINITHMTSSEFVGHIDDINTEYDAIYFGDSYDNWNFLRNGDLTNGKQVSLYAHAGGIFGGDADGEQTGHLKTTTRLLGLLDIDYAKDDNGNTYFARKKSKNEYTIYSSKNAELKTDLRLLLSPNAGYPICNKIGRMRGSGNDITEQQVKQLKAFVSSGYPVIIGDGLLNDDGTVKTSVVDSSSYMYEFLNDAVNKEKNRANVMSKKEADSKQNLNFFFYMAKPKLVFDEMPPEPKRLTTDGTNSTYTYNKEAGMGTLGQDEEGLSYTFTIKNDSEISSATATYNCELFIDLNFDGNLSSKEEQSEYMQIQDEKGNVVKKENDKYHLKIGKKYTLTRKIPKDYYKVITWKIQISNNENSSIRTSRMGFAKRKAEKKQEIKVLQIYSEDPPVYVDGKPNTAYYQWDSNKNTWKKSLAGVTWYLKQDDEFQKMLAEVDDFKITIDEMVTRKYEDAYKANKKMLDEYQMIIIGFADGFGIDNISNKDGAVTAIRKFIEDGKSVIFAHDTTSFVNTPEDVLRTSAAGSDSNVVALYNPNVSGQLDPMQGAWNWGYSLNTFLRASVGMDRYGITSDEPITVNGNSSTVSTELKKGNDLIKQENQTKGNDIYEIIKNKVSDMAYVFGNKKTSSFMTQGYANNVLGAGNYYTWHVSKVNEGAITQYPYHTSDLISTTQTHSQYYQLAMEEDSDQDGANDIVVWYCLGYQSGDNGVYQQSPNDVRNNYYFYSKGNVIYTGVGDTGEPAKTGKITKEEKQLFVNAIVAAANVTAVDPEATFLDDFDPVSNQEDYRYYMPDRLKTSEVSGTSNILDGDNTFNIRIRDYNMVASNLSHNSNNSGSLTMELYIEDPNGKEMEINGEKVHVSKISIAGKSDVLKKYSDGQTIKVQDDGIFKLPGNDTFQFTLDNMESYLKRSNGTYKKECRIFAKIKSTVTLYGTTANKETWTSISLKPRQLFDLD